MKIHEKFNFGSYQRTAQCVLGRKINKKKRKRVNEHPWATTEASDGSRPPRSAAASGRLFLPAAAWRLWL